MVNKCRPVRREIVALSKIDEHSFYFVSEKGRLRNGKRVVSEKSSPIQSSDYLSNGTQMKVVVRLAEPISRSIERRTKSEENLSNPVEKKPQRTIFSLIFLVV